MKALTILSVLFFTLLFSSTTFAENYFCSKELETLPILQGGRVKPLYVHASEVMKSLTGKSKIKDLSAVDAYCLLSLNGMGLINDIKINARIYHVDAKKFLKLPDGQNTIAFEELLKREEDIRNEARMSKDESYKKAMGKLFDSIYLYKEIKSGTNWTLAESTGSALSWPPFITYLTEEKVIAQKLLTPSAPFLPVLMKSKDNYIQAAGSKYMLEYYYAKSRLPIVAMFITIIALASMALFKNFKIALSLAALSLGAQLIMLTIRIIISGRGPITNMYETVLFSGAGALLLAMILGHTKKRKNLCLHGPWLFNDDDDDV